MKDLLDRYVFLLSQVLKSPQSKISDLLLLDKKHQQEIIDTSCEENSLQIEKLSVVEKFEKITEKYPEKTALIVNDASSTYSQIGSSANKLANYLIELNITTESVIGVCLPRSADMIISMLAIMKAGAVYLPLDPAYPDERLNYMLQDSGATHIITSADYSKNFSKRTTDLIDFALINDELNTKSDSNPDLRIELTRAAYIIYTSGSTGKPKGVVVEHQAFTDHCAEICAYYELSSHDNVLQFAALNFDASLEQIIPTFLVGGTLIMRGEDIWTTSEFFHQLQKYKLSVINPPTAYWNELSKELFENQDNLTNHNLRLIIVGGDVLRSETIEFWQNSILKEVRLLNAYGPTEAVITASTYDVPKDFDNDTVPIGRQRGNRSFYIVDRYLNLTPNGIPGELLIGGNNIARGYHNRPELDREKFIDNPFANGHVYRTGDLVKALPDGNLVFLGRVDEQVKIRGFRIELGEIESILEQHSAVERAIAVVLRDSANEEKIVIYYITYSESSLETDELTEHLKKELPYFMLPSAYIEIAEIPLSPAGKLDKNALPKPDFSILSQKTEFIEPRTETEKLLAEIVKAVLKIDQVGIKDSFFELGGHSMMATQVVSRIREKFNVEISLRTMFENPTIEGISKAILDEQMSFQDEEEISEMLDELEGLSEEEITKLLED